MEKIKAINNDADLDAAMSRIDELFRKYPDILEAGPGSAAYDELSAISDLVIAYEDIHYPIEPLTLAQAIEIGMEDAGMTPDDLTPCLGSREAVAEVLAGRREVTPEMAQALYESLNIDVRGLLGQPTSPTLNS